MQDLQVAAVTVSTGLKKSQYKALEAVYKKDQWAAEALIRNSLEGIKLLKQKIIQRDGTKKI